MDDVMRPVGPRVDALSASEYWHVSCGPCAVPRWLPQELRDNAARRSLMGAGRFAVRRVGAMCGFHYAIGRRWYRIHPRVGTERICQRLRPIGWGSRRGWIRYA